MFADFVAHVSELRVYEEISDIDGIVPKMEEYLADYNSESKVMGCSLYCSVVTYHVLVWYGMMYTSHVVCVCCHLVSSSFLFMELLQRRAWS